MTNQFRVMKRCLGPLLDETSFTTYLVEAGTEDEAFAKLGHFLHENLATFRYHNGPVVLTRGSLGDQLTHTVHACWELGLKKHDEFFYLIPDQTTFPDFTMVLQ